MALCGDKASITIAGQSTAFEGHKFTITSKALEENTRKFGDGPYGSWLGCALEGTITVSHYLPIPNLTVGGAVTISGYLGTGNAYPFSCPNCMTMEVNKDVDAKGLVELQSTFKITGTPTGV